MTKRSIINSGFANDFLYCYIDHYLNMDQFGPYGNDWKTGTIFNRKWCDPLTGVQTVITPEGPTRQWGGGMRLQSPIDYSGVYVLDNFGATKVRLNFVYPNTLVATGGYNWEYSPGGGTQTFQAIDPTQPVRVEFEYNPGVGGSDEMLLMGVQHTLLDDSDPDALPTYPRFYRLEDETDLNAGKMFRRGWLKTIVDLNPSIFRVMDWTGGNNSQECRWRDRMPATFKVISNWNFMCSRPYLATEGVNRMTLESDGEALIELEHGLIITTRIGDGCGLSNASAKPILGITNASNGAVNVTGHGYEVGDKVVHYIVDDAGMTELHMVLCEVLTVPDANHYTIDVNTTGFTPYVAFDGGDDGADLDSFVVMYTSLNVDGLGEYPVVFPTGAALAGLYGDAYLAERDTKTFWFDKNLIVIPGIQGAFIFSNLNSTPHGSVCPPEIVAKLGNELNALAQELGGDRIDIWLCLPHRMMLSNDPDYDDADNFAKGYMTELVANMDEDGPQWLAWVEHANETWNAGGDPFSQSAFYARLGYQRKPSIGKFNYAYYHTLRAAIMIEDIRDAIGDHGRVRFVMCGQGTIGPSGNAGRIFGNNDIMTDPLYPWGEDRPADHYHMFGYASYLFIENETADLPTFVSDWSAATNDEERDAIVAAYVATIVNNPFGETIKYYTQKLHDYSEAVIDEFPDLIIGQYEGEWDHNIGFYRHVAGAVENGSNEVAGDSGSYALLSEGDYIVGRGIPWMTKITDITGGTLTLSNAAVLDVNIADLYAFNAENMFLYAAKRSTHWAKVVKEYFDQWEFLPNCAYPSAYTMIGLRWGASWADAFDKIGTGVEGSGYGAVYHAQALRNHRKNLFRVTTE